MTRALAMSATGQSSSGEATALGYRYRAALHDSPPRSQTWDMGSPYAQPILLFFCRPCGEYHETTSSQYHAMKPRKTKRLKAQPAKARRQAQQESQHGIREILAFQKQTKLRDRHELSGLVILPNQYEI